MEGKDNEAARAAIEESFRKRITDAKSAGDQELANALQIQKNQEIGLQRAREAAQQVAERERREAEEKRNRELAAREAHRQGPRAVASASLSERFFDLKNRFEQGESANPQLKAAKETAETNKSIKKTNEQLVSLLQQVVQRETGIGGHVVRPR